MRILIWIIVAVIVLAVIYFVMQKNKTTVSPLQSVATASAAPISNCIPFTKAQQDAEKRTAQAKCANKLIIPIVGPTQYAACMKNVEISLTPVNNC